MPQMHKEYELAQFLPLPSLSLRSVEKLFAAVYRLGNSFETVGAL